MDSSATPPDPRDQNGDITADAPRAQARRKPTKSVLGTTVPLEEFLNQAYSFQLDRWERERIVDQALILIEQLYVHLPLKRAMHAIDPVQRLKLLRRRIASLSEPEFNAEMLMIFTELRDLHTNYLLPEPFRNRTALLPFQLEEFFEGDQRRYMVSHVTDGFRHTWFKPGVIVTHWNGLRIDRAVALNADRQMGSNTDARHARGLEAMTIRPLMLSLPPDEEWITVRYVAKGETHESQFKWRVIEPEPSPTGVDPDNGDHPTAYGLGYDALTEIARRVKKTLFARKAVETEKRMAALTASGADLNTRAVSRDLKKTSLMPDVFAFRTVETPHGTFGYIRIWTFLVDNADAFVHEFVRIAEMLPQNGLIIDVRGNGGGLIMAGERLLQVLTPRAIEPSRFHFINTPLTLALCQRVEPLRQWVESIDQSIETGAAYSFGFPIDSSEENNTIGQKYYGPVVLIVDALCYSTTDIFAAGFQDHNIGVILGTTGNTGAGGANVWTHELLQSFLPSNSSPIRPLPNRASFRVAIRRTTRIGERAGVPLEGLGVIPDERHRMTANDLLNNNEDMINHAASLLVKMPVHEIDAEIVSKEDGKVKIDATTSKISRLDVWVGGRPHTSLDVQDGKTSLTVPTNGHRIREIELRGFDSDELVAVKRLALNGRRR